jgi:3-oxoadipate enol-lactonase
MGTPAHTLPTRDEMIGDTFVRISGQGFPLVFVHGFTTTSEFWGEQAKEFSETYRVVRINLPGHGASPAPLSRGYGLDDFVEDINQVFRELGIEKAVLIGLSMGGIVAQKFALKHGHLLKALVLADTTAHGIGPEATADAFLRAVAKQGYTKAVQDLSDMSFSSSASPAVREWARREVIQTPEFVARAAVRSLNDADTRGALSQIEVPTLVIAGEQDRVTPPQESEILANGIRGSTLALIPGAGHFSMVEDPVAFDRILRKFVDGVRSSGA